jgi:hypothetical protein
LFLQLSDYRADMSLALSVQVGGGEREREKRESLLGIAARCPTVLRGASQPATCRRSKTGY